MQEQLDNILTNSILMFYLLLVTALLLTRIPIVGKYFRSVNTMIHEAAHAFMTLAVSGQIISINLFADTSGSTVTKAKGKPAQFMIAIAGYPFSALVGFLLMFLLSGRHDLYILFILLSIVLILMVLSIRNAYGLFWATSFALINLLLIYFDNKTAIHLAAIFFTLIVVTDSFISAFVLLVLSLRDKKKAGDATNLQKITKIPATIWSLLFVAFSAFMIYLSAIHYFPPIKEIFDGI
jgi:hypothetical protein